MAIMAYGAGGYAAGRRVQPYICYRRGCGLELPMFVFLVLSMLYPNDTNRICEGHEDLPSCKAVLNSKRSLPVLKWTSESEYF